MNRENDIPITVNGGQFNISRDNSTLYATQNNSNGNIPSELESIINEIEKNRSSLEKETGDQLLDIVNMVQTELNNQTPRPSRLKNCLTLLAPMVTIANGIPVLHENLQKLQNLISSFIK